MVQKTGQPEQRFIATANLKALRAESQPVRLRGYAALFNVESLDLGGYTEIIAKGAFTRAIAEKQDVRALFNHDANFVLGRTTSGTLTLSEDDKGLLVDIVPPDTQWAKDLIMSIERGDINQMSFAFWVVSQEWVDMKDKPRLRRLLDVDLGDTSIVTFPAYVQTSIGTRGIPTRTEDVSLLSVEQQVALRGALDALQSHRAQTDHGTRGKVPANNIDMMQRKQKLQEQV